MEWVPLVVQGGAWVVFGVLFATGRIISRTQADALVGLWQQRGDEWKAVADVAAAAAAIDRENTRRALEGLSTFEALLRSIEREAMERRRAEERGMAA
jgi:hypothetical protein